jgi:peptidyl-prolyl cis-trans isomerase SurA
VIRNRARRFFVASMLATALAMLVVSGAHAQQIVALVNGQPITALDVEQRSKFMQMTAKDKKAPPRKEVIDSLIDEILEINEAKRFTLEVSDAQVDEAFANVAKNMGADPQKLSQVLASAGASADTLKRRLRAQMAWTPLVRGRYKASLEIQEGEVEQQLKPEEKGQVGYEYIMNPVVFIVPRGSPDSAFEARKQDAETLRTRFQSCDSGIRVARSLRDVAVRDQVSKYSADLPQQLRGILDGTPVGHLTPPERTAEGVQMFAVCDKRETKTETPGKRAARDQILQQRFAVKAKRYLQDLRRGAMIEYKTPEDQATK